MLLFFLTVQVFKPDVVGQLSPLSYQSIKHEDVILITLRVFHHDVEEGIQSVLEELDKEEAVFRERADRKRARISSLPVLPREQGHTSTMCHIQ